MTRRTRASSSKEPSSFAVNEISPDSFVVISSFSPKMSAKSIVKTINLLGLPKGYEVLTPIEYQRANNPPPGCLIVYVAQCISGLRFPLHLFLVGGRVLTVLTALAYRAYRRELFRFVLPTTYTEGELLPLLPSPRPTEWEVPLAWRSSLNELPPINFESVKERVKAVGLLDHGFKPKAQVEEDLLIVAGLHPTPDTYTGPRVVTSASVMTMMNRAPVCKFLPENVPSNPLSSSSTRSASATPSNIESSGGGRSPSRTPPVVGPNSASPSPTPSGYVDVPRRCP
ncbi:hypothetical protein Salat_1186400 [Sesamum alatum]|uniref:Uncharacterized protein n=1 Tax=Sesamum alatum TaxID=300844 RepID=A0AAE1YEV5_9LAMI|nr:hypothetical protein Salat_1186400 [Sesamum alatum]